MIKMGIDIVSIPRIEKLIEKHGSRGLERFLTPCEMATAKTASSIAGLWAAKEAVSKALECGIGKELSFHDIIISKKSSGAPMIELSPREITQNVQSISLSITHDGGFAIAAVIVQLNASTTTNKMQ